VSPGVDQARDLYDRHGEKLRFLVVGVVNTIIGYALFYVLWRLFGPAIGALSASSARPLAFIGEKNYLVVQWIGWAMAVPISTTTMKYFAFRSKGRLLPQIGRAYFVYLPAQAIATAMLWFSVNVLRLSVPVGQLVTIFVTTIFSYLGHKYFTFKTPLEVGEVPPQEMVDPE
jgi:putative flippase GtrA